MLWILETVVAKMPGADDESVYGEGTSCLKMTFLITVWEGVIRL